MPFTWLLVIYCSATLFGIAADFTLRRTHWLGLYLLACMPASIIWGMQMWRTSMYLRPALLALQAMAVIEAICLLHENCWEPQRRYWLAGFCGLCAIAATFAAAEYPGYPKALWWVQLWLEVGATASCCAALAVWRWFRNFRPAGWTIGNVAIMAVYCGLEAGALLISNHVTAYNWLNVDVGLALAQDVCLFWWIGLNTRDL